MADLKILSSKGFSSKDLYITWWPKTSPKIVHKPKVMSAAEKELMMNLLNWANCKTAIENFKSTSKEPAHINRYWKPEN